LALVLFLSWDYVKQFLPAGTDSPVTPAPAAVYDRRAAQDELKPMGYSEAREKREVFFSADEAAGLYGEGETVKDAVGLMAAVKKAKAGAVIRLASGEYRANLFIDKDLSLSGAGSSTVLVAADQKQPVIKSANAKLTLANLVVRDSEIGLLAEGGEVTVRRVRFDKLSATACYGSNAKLDFQESYVYDSLSGVKLANATGQIKDAIIKDNGKAGADLRQSDLSLSGNVITGNDSYGVYADGYSKVALENNFIADNKGWNVRLEGERSIYE
jgi:nitrous oxidase accessory protein NosD